MADLAAQLFYDRLFALDPSLHPLFKHDMARQRLKLMNRLQQAVAALDDFERIVPTLQNLGRDHAGYGVQDAHYATVGEALIWTLTQLLGDRFTEEVRDAWLETYNLLSRVMREAAAETQPSTFQSRLPKKILVYFNYTQLAHR